MVCLITNFVSNKSYNAAVVALHPQFLKSLLSFTRRITFLSFFILLIDISVGVKIKLRIDGRHDPEIFISLLGPMGIAEYDELQINDSIKIDKILDYIDDLKKDRILDDRDSNEFEFKVKKIFNDNYSDDQDKIKFENNSEGGFKL